VGLKKEEDLRAVWKDMPTLAEAAENEDGPRSVVPYDFYEKGKQGELSLSNPGLGMADVQELETG